MNRRGKNGHKSGGREEKPVKGRKVNAKHRDAMITTKRFGGEK